MWARLFTGCPAALREVLPALEIIRENRLSSFVMPARFPAARHHGASSRVQEIAPAENPGKIR
jgi:hypothetical protein